MIIEFEIILIGILLQMTVIGVMILHRPDKILKKLEPTDKTKETK